MFKFNKSLLIIIAGSLIFALIAGGRLPYFLLYVVLSTAALSFLWTALPLLGMKFSQNTGEGIAHVGNEVRIETVLKNRTILPVPYVEVRNDIIKSLSGTASKYHVVSLKPLSVNKIKDRATCRYRGIYPLGPVSIDISDVFGIFKWRRTMKCEGKLYVYPKVIKLRSFSLKPSQIYGNKSARHKLQEDYSSISDIRKYNTGDSIRKIHWKVSARKGSYHVKNFEMDGNMEAYVFLNLYKCDYDNLYRADIEEKAIECAASIINYTLLKGIRTEIYANSKDMGHAKGKSIGDFSKFMDLFLRVKSDGITAAGDFIAEKSQLIPGGASIIFITPSINEAMTDKILQLKIRGFEVIIVLIAEEEINREILQRINGYGIKHFKLKIGDDTRASLEG